MQNENSEIKTNEQLPWNKPEVQKLTVNLDTAGQIPGLQSSIDLADEG